MTRLETLENSLLSRALFILSILMGSQLIVIRSFSFLPGLVGITYIHDIKIGLMDL